MSLTAFAAIVFAVAAFVCLVSFTHVMVLILRKVSFPPSDKDIEDAVDKTLDNAKWYTVIAAYSMEPSFYIAVGGLLLAIGSAVFSLA